MIKWSTGVYRDWVHLKCLDCPADAMGEDAESAEKEMREHCDRKGHGNVVKSSVEEVRRVALTNERLNGVTVTLGYLSWNTLNATAEGLYALALEAMCLRELGAGVCVYVVDNGSGDSAIDALHTKMKAHPEIDWRQVWLLPLDHNEGISKARNRIINFSNAVNSDFVLFLDGDIEVVPYSVYHMVRYLRCHEKVGCIGAYPASWTPDRGKEDEVLAEIPESRVRNDISCAFTQYGLFRSKMFKGRGALRFETGGPFGGPGWGLEDDDMYLQMTANGWENRYFSGMTYLHRALHSSWDTLGKKQVLKGFQDRKAFLVEKWGEDKRLDPGIINLIRAQSLSHV